MGGAGEFRRIRQEAQLLAHENQKLVEELQRARLQALETQAQVDGLNEALRNVTAFPECADAAVQCDMKGSALQSVFKPVQGGSGARKESAPPSEFSFRKRDRRLNWKQLQRVSVGRIAATNDVNTLCRLMDDIMHADIEAESLFHLTEGNLLKLFQLAQLTLQYVDHERRILDYQYTDFLDNRTLVLRLLERAGVASLDDLRNGTSDLSSKFSGLAGPELEDMFGKVRMEERALSRMALAGAVEETKRRYEAEMEEEELLREGRSGELTLSSDSRG